MGTLSGILLNSLSLASFLASIFAALQGDFAYPVEITILALLGILMVMTLALPSDDAAGAFIAAVFFLASLANLGYMHSVAGYISPARLGALAITLSGLAVSALALMSQPAPPHLTREARKLLAAEKKISAAREQLEAVKETIPNAIKGRKRKRRK